MGDRPKASKTEPIYAETRCLGVLSFQESSIWPPDLTAITFDQWISTSELLRSPGPFPPKQKVGWSSPIQLKIHLHHIPSDMCVVSIWLYIISATVLQIIIIMSISIAYCVKSISYVSISISFYIEGSPSRVHFNMQMRPQKRALVAAPFEHKPTDSQTHSPLPNCEETNCNGLCLGRHVARKQGRV